MSTIQIVGIAVATTIVVLLAVALIVTRKSGEAAASETAEPSPEGSFLDTVPSDTLEKLGKPEHLPEAAVAPAAGAAAGTDALGLDWDRSREPPVADAGAAPAEVTGEMPAVAAAPPVAAGTVAVEVAESAVQAVPVVEPALEAEPAAQPAVEPALERALEAEPAAEPAFEPVVQPVAVGPRRPATAAPAAGDHVVPLSSIIVTTSTKMVDLDDPEIRRMLTDLVTFEIDQATQFREQGQSLDAVLQLTEAEKICRALGKVDTAREIRDMMHGLQA